VQKEGTYFSFGLGFQEDIDIRYKDVKGLNGVRFSFNPRN
jgi:hypothetical protein